MTAFYRRLPGAEFETSLKVFHNPMDAPWNVPCRWPRVHLRASSHTVGPSSGFEFPSEVMTFDRSR